MTYYVATQNEFDSIAMSKNEAKYLVTRCITRCRCQPNTCSRPVCRGCVDCLGRYRCHFGVNIDLSQKNLLKGFFGN